MDKPFKMDENWGTRILGNLQVSLSESATMPITSNHQNAISCLSFRLMHVQTQTMTVAYYSNGLCANERLFLEHLGDVHVWRIPCKDEIVRSTKIESSFDGSDGCLPAPRSLTKMVPPFLWMSCTTCGVNFIHVSGFTMPPSCVQLLHNYSIRIMGVVT